MEPTRDLPPTTLLRPREAAARLGVSEAKLKGWRTGGGGPRWVRLDGSVRYPDDALAEFIASLPAGAAS